MTDDLIAFLHQQFENQRFRGESLKTLAFAMPAPETGAYLTETGDLLLADVDAKRRILDEHYPVDPCDAHDASLRTITCDTVRLLALPFAAHPDYPDKWRP